MPPILPVESIHIAMSTAYVKLFKVAPPLKRAQRPLRRNISVSNLDFSCASSLCQKPCVDSGLLVHCIPLSFSPRRSRRGQLSPISPASPKPKIRTMCACSASTKGHRCHETRTSRILHPPQHRPTPHPSPRHRHSRRQTTRPHHFAGKATTEAPATDDTLGPLPLSPARHTSGIVSFIAGGRESLRTKASAIFPDIQGGGREDITLRHLLSHTSGSALRRTILPSCLGSKFTGNA